MQLTSSSSATTPSLLELKKLLRREQALGAVQAKGTLAKTGFADLDKALPQAGWSAGVLELLLDLPGHGELSLLLPAMRQLQAEGRWIALVNPPAVPYAPGLQYAGVDLSRLVVLPNLASEQAAWASEQLLQNASCGLVLAWFNPQKAKVTQRLQLAAKAQNNLCVLCRPLAALRQSSLAQSRIELQAHEQGALLRLHKLQGELRRPEVAIQWASLE